MKESTKREASTRPDDVDSRPGAAARAFRARQIFGKGCGSAFDGLQGNGKEA